MPHDRSIDRAKIVRVCAWAIYYACRRWLLLGAVLATRVVSIGLDLLKPWPMAFLIDYVLRGKKMPDWLAGWIALLPGSGTPVNLINWTVITTVIVFLLNWCVSLADGFAMLSLRQRMNYNLAGDVFLKMQQLSLQFHARSAVAENMRRVTSDSSCASSIVLDALLPACTAAFSLVAMVGILWRIDTILALISFTVVPYMAFILSRFSFPLKEEGRELLVRQGRLHTVVEQSFSAIPAVQACCREASNSRRFRQVAQEVLTATLSRTRTNLQFTVLLGFATAAGSTAILWIGGHKALAGTMSIGAIIAFLSYLGSLYGHVEKLLQTAPAIHNAVNRAEYLWEILHSKTIIREKRGAPKLCVSSGSVRFENITFGYEAARPVLRKIAFECFPGQTIALVGATGSGKTTLISLLPRFFDPWEGAVLIDGQDVRDVQLKSLRRSIGFVLQDPFLFPVSVAENISYGCSDVTFDRIEAAARDANAHEFISRLPDGYNTIIGERGATFSGGERQRISIARAFLKNAPILILDEPTSALDAETEQSLVQSLRRLARGRSTFLVAHRLSTVRHADLILVFKDGRIVERGTHAELIECGGIYTRFYEFQSPDLPRHKAAVTPMRQHNEAGDSF